jgi:hypothetical protein
MDSILYRVHGNIFVTYESFGFNFYGGVFQFEYIHLLKFAKLMEQNSCILYFVCVCYVLYGGNLYLLYMFRLRYFKTAKKTGARSRDSSVV